MELIVTTPQELRTILGDCLKEYEQSKTTTAPQPEKYLYSIIELAGLLHCSVAKAQALKNSGKIRFKQYGRKVIFVESEVLQDIAAGRRKEK